MKKFVILVCIFCTFISATRKEMTWVAIGDSITYLNEHPDEAGTRITKGYMTRVVEKLPYIHYVNQGHNGWTSGEIATEIEKLGLTKADIYSVFLGTNDWWRGRPLGSLNDYIKNTGNETVYGSFRIIVNKLRSLNPNAKVVMITPMQRADFMNLGNMTNNAYGSYKEKNGQMLEQFAGAVDSIGDYENFDVVDLFHAKGMGLKHLVKYKRLKEPGTQIYKNYSYPDFISIPFDPQADDYPYPEDAIDVTYDGLHPSDKGFEMIARKLVRVMRRW
jgi:lysophospholipase L1-like esterase